MKQTLGNRIVQHRKKLGMTQDQLAERLGVTAQAVSKWENDQSCPDISTLPKLAALFGISIDELLGHSAPQQPVFHGEVAEECESEANNDRWVFKWDPGRRSTVGFACWVLLMGGLLMTESLTQTDIGFWNLAWPSALVMIGLFSGKKFSFFRLGCILLGGWFLLDHVGLIPVEMNNRIVWPALVILFGISLLADALRKPKKPHFSVTHGSKQVDIHSQKETSSYETDDNSFDCSLTFGEATRYIELPLLRHGDISLSFGELTVDLSGCQLIAEDCEIDASCYFGELTILVPKQYLIESDSSAAFASYEVNGQPDPVPISIIHLDASVSFGTLKVHYI